MTPSKPPAVPGRRRLPATPAHPPTGGLEMHHLRQLIALDRLLRAESGTRAELAQRLGERTGLPTSERTISRYVEELRLHFGLLAEYDPLTRAYRYQNPSRRLPVGLFLSTDAWLMAEWLASVVGADPHVPGRLSEALAQLRGGRPSGPLPRSFRTLPRPARVKRHGGVLDGVERWWIATQEGRLLAFDYPVRGDTGAYARRDVEPHGIAFVDGWFQLDGWDRGSGDWRTFLPSRMRNLKDLPTRFERRDWDPDRVYAGAFRRKRGTGDHRVELLLSRRVAFLARDLEQHPSQRLLETRPDGGVRVEFRLSYLYEVLNWVLSLGAECRVVHPPELVALVRSSVAALAGAYGLKVEGPPPAPPAPAGEDA